MQMTRLFSGFVPSTAAALYTTPALAGLPSGTLLLKEIVLCNVDSGAVDVSISIGPDALTPASAVVWNLSLATEETVVLDFNSAIEADEVFWGLASAADSIACRISGVI